MLPNRHDSDLMPEVRGERAIGVARPAVPMGARVREVVPVPIASLLPGESPRLKGQDAEHVAQLGELDVALPPILVHRRSMRVIDGMHRLMVALLRGRETIDVEFFDGTQEEAFLRAVEANVTHGLPLTKEDRRAAAARIIAAHPEMSDRAIARTAGLGAKAVAALRRSSADTTSQLTGRIGRDGKVRPLNSSEGRRRAAELLAEHPEASLREVARRARISPATVSDVRKRLLSGEPPVPEGRQRGREPDDDHSGSPDRTPPDGMPPPDRVALAPADRVAPDRPPAARKVCFMPSDPVSLIEKLLRDPSLRHKEEGRNLLRILQQNAIDMQEWSKLTAVVPSHCGGLVADLARRYSETWREIAKELGERRHTVSDETQDPTRTTS